MSKSSDVSLNYSWKRRGTHHKDKCLLEPVCLPRAKCSTKLGKRNRFPFAQQCSHCSQFVRRRLAGIACSTSQLIGLNGTEGGWERDSRVYQLPVFCREWSFMPVNQALSSYHPLFIPISTRNPQAFIKDLANFLSLKPQLFQPQGPHVLFFPHVSSLSHMLTTMTRTVYFS